MASRFIALALLIHQCTAAGPNTLASHEQKLVNGVNATLGVRAAERLQYELTLPEAAPADAEADKTTMSIIMFFGLNLLGIDRCMLGQTCIGTVKGLTLGGFFIWWIVDHFVMLYNILTQAPEINTIGFHATWEQDTIKTAFYVSLFCLLWNCLAPARAANNSKQSNGKEVKPEEADYKLLDA